MHGMTDLVQRLVLVHQKPAVVVEHTVFEEEPGLVARREEVLVAAVRLVIGGEDRPDAIGVEVVDQFPNTSPDGPKHLLAHGIGEDRHAIFGKVSGCVHQLSPRRNGAPSAAGMRRRCEKKTRTNSTST